MDPLFKHALISIASASPLLVRPNEQNDNDLPM
jgi:hypothetical protein